MDFHVFLQPVPTGETTYLGWLLQGLRTTVLLSACAWAVALVLGSLLGVFRTVPSRALRAIAGAYVEVFRNVPLLVQLFIWYFVVPEIVPGGERFKQIDPWLQQFLASMFCLGLFTAARVCEQVRAGIESLARGQRNAALALGLTLPQTYRHVLLPMAGRIIVPPLTSETLNVFKNSAVCSTIGLLELTAQGRQLVDYTARAYESFLAVTVLYLLLNAAVLLIMRKVEARTRVPGYLGSGR
ncbi:MAG: amino acid ABC transporter permease [Deltaproteobacteria bacterium]|nr:MAG: amino acid ABC transporter permease [Deltaproteobacteria bacterium]TMB28534.1 MAG: amino acid ABC transporter permease [Deltaproteobacteria bacterium]